MVVGLLVVGLVDVRLPVGFLVGEVRVDPVVFFLVVGLPDVGRLVGLIGFLVVGLIVVGVLVGVVGFMVVGVAVGALVGFIGDPVGKLVGALVG